MMQEFKNNEQLIYFILNNFRLSRIDYKFFNSLSLSSISNNRVTSNQVKLYYKILEKHKKQINKHRLSLVDIQQLPWNCEVIESGKEYTEGYVEIVGGKIIIKTPYQRNFINEYRKNPIYSMVWNKDKRQHEIDYNTINFKKIKTLLEKHYSNINYCDVSKSLLNKINEYIEVKYWDPTLVYVNGNFHVYAITEVLYNLIRDYKFDDITHVSDMVSLGITIDDSVVNYFLEQGYSADFVQLATHYHNKFETRDINKIVGYIFNLQCDGVLEVGSFSNIDSVKEYRETIKNYGIKISKLISYEEAYKKPIIINFRNNEPMVVGKTYKHIKFVNSQPIDIFK